MMSTAGENQFSSPEATEIENDVIILPPSVTKLSASATEFFPGRPFQPPSSPGAVACYLDSSSDDRPTRTSPCVNKNNENLKPEEMTSVDSQNAFDFENLGTCHDEAIEKTNLEGEKGDEWKMATKRNLRRLPQKTFGLQNSESDQSRNQGFADGKLPGEAVAIDNFRRFVVWSTDLDIARRSLAQGRLALILMRGVPGSGKTTLAKSLQANGIICSADEYFLQEESSYQFDPTRLDDAHTWCLQRAVQAVSGGVTPVIIDNTNVCLWEMAKYVKLAIRNNYDVYFVEPNTDWKSDAAECARRNNHRVPYESIERMIQRFQKVTALRGFLESGILRPPVVRPICVPDAPTQTATLETADVSRSSSSPDVVELKKQEARELQSPADVWGSSDSSSWENEEQPKADELPSVPAGLQASSSTSSMPKEQRASRPSTTAFDARGSPKAQDAKKSDTPVRRKRPDGYGGLSFGLATGAWQLPDDLAGGLSAAGNEEDPGSVFEENAVTTSVREIYVRDGTVQVTDKHLALASLQHRRLSRHSNDGCEFCPEERKITKLASRCAISCDRSVQCEHDGTVVALSDDDGYARAMTTLRSCFPQVYMEDIEEIFAGCGGQLELAVNVLLDSGYDVDWSTRERSIEKEPDAEPKVGMELADLDEAPMNSCTASKALDVQVAPEGLDETIAKDDTSRPLVDTTHAATDDASVDGESPLYTMELSVDMAKQLQRMFTSMFPDIPPDLLSPSQLKFRIPHPLAAALFRCWLDTQANDGYSEGDSDFYSNGSVADELPSENFGEKLSDSIGQRATASHREEDSLAIEQQILNDEQFAHQLALEEEGAFEPKLDAGRTAGAPSTTMASQIKLKRIHELFPSVDRSFLKSLFTNNNCDLDGTIDMLCDTYNIPKQTRTGSPGRAYAARAAQKPAVRQDEVSDATESEELTYEELRQEARVHFEERQANFQKAQDYYRKGMAAVAYYYAQRGHLHNKKFKEANERAAAKILRQRKAANPAGVLDLHGLHVSEAIQVLVDVLRESENRPGKEIKIITGQGLHSTNGPKIKPAVVNYLRQRRYNFMEMTPGVLLVTMK